MGKDLGFCGGGKDGGDKLPTVRTKLNWSGSIVNYKISTLDLCKQRCSHVECSG